MGAKYTTEQAMSIVFGGIAFSAIFEKAHVTLATMTLVIWCRQQFKKPEFTPAQSTQLHMVSL
jgi:hypothetical protein